MKVLFYIQYKSSSTIDSSAPSFYYRILSILLHQKIAIVSALIFSKQRQNRMTIINKALITMGKLTCDLSHCRWSARPAATRQSLAGAPWPPSPSRRRHGHIVVPAPTWPGRLLCRRNPNCCPLEVGEEERESRIARVLNSPPPPEPQPPPSSSSSVRARASGTRRADVGVWERVAPSRSSPMVTQQSFHITIYS